MTHGEIKPNARWLIRFVINFRAFIFDFTFTFKVMTAGHSTVRNGRLIFFTVTVSGGRTTFNIFSLVMAVISRMASTLLVISA